MKSPVLESLPKVSSIDSQNKMHVWGLAKLSLPINLI